MTLDQLLKLHDQTCENCRDIMKRKSLDYTGGKKASDPFANFRTSELVGVNPVKGIMLRVLDKIQRINSFTNDGELQVEGETVDDACEDIVNYAILAKAMLKEQRAKASEEAREALTTPITYS